MRVYTVCQALAVYDITFVAFFFFLCANTVSNSEHPSDNPADLTKSLCLSHKTYDVSQRLFPKETGAEQPHVQFFVLSPNPS